MKSIYLNEDIHSKIKLIATLEKRSIASVVEEFLEKELRKKLTDLPAEALQQLAARGGSFDFLNNPAEDIYTEDDGEPIE